MVCIWVSDFEGGQSPREEKNPDVKVDVVKPPTSPESGHRSVTIASEPSAETTAVSLTPEKLTVNTDSGAKSIAMAELTTRDEEIPPPLPATPGQNSHRVNRLHFLSFQDSSFTQYLMWKDL